MRELLTRIDASLARIDQSITWFETTDSGDEILDILCRVNDDLKRARQIVVATMETGVIQ